jgi:uncharacterized membrane protein
MLRSMNGLQAHLRNKFLAGILAAVPLVILVVGGLWVEEKTRPLAAGVGLDYPGLGILIALVAVYLLGLLVTSLMGRFFLGLIDHTLRRIPGLKLLYQAWKDILVVGAGKKDMYSHVVYVPSPDSRGVQLGFTNGDPTPNDPASLCVFLPNVPNPITGRLIIIERAQCRPTNLSMEEAFKFLLSTGNYFPADKAPGEEKA